MSLIDALTELYFEPDPDPVQDYSWIGVALIVAEILLIVERMLSGQ